MNIRDVGWRSASDQNPDELDPDDVRRTMLEIKERRLVIMMLDDIVARYELSEDDADAILLLWDSKNFPKQVPRPLRERAMRGVLPVRTGTS